VRFDAYRATVPASPAHLEAILVKGLSGRACIASAPHKNYKQAISIQAGGQAVRMSWGGFNPLPFVDVQGEISDDLAHVLREAYPDHSCGRADACLDFKGGRDGFQDVSEHLVGIAQRYGVSTRLIASPSHPEQGRTLYVGSRTSEVMARLYEKGRQLQEQKGDASDLDLVRFEVEVKPNKKQRKLQLAKIPAEEISGFSRWSAQAQSLVTCNVVPFTPRHTDRKSASEQALRHMTQQYQNTATQFVREQGKAALFNLLADFYRQACNGQ